MDNDWIKLFRKFREWGWYKDANTVRVWLELLLTANFEDKEWLGVQIKRGQTVIGRKQLAETLGISEQNVRTALTRLKSTNEITSKTYSKFSVVTINKYNDYQKPTNNLTSIQPASNQHLTTPKEYKNIRNNIYGGQYLSKWNEVFKTKYTSTKSIDKPLKEWLDTYSIDDIYRAIENIRYDPYWKDKDISPDWLLRFKDKTGDIDRIGRMLNVKKSDTAIRL